MLYALNQVGSLVEASKGVKCTCPGCREEVIPKCGRIKTWHFSHKQKDCDPWSEPETLWHRGWKEYVPIKNREVVIKPHRADIRLDTGLVVELQHSSISCEEIQEREEFYKNMIWVFDAREFAEKCMILSIDIKTMEGSRYSSLYLNDLQDPEIYKSLIAAHEWALWAQLALKGRRNQRREFEEQYKKENEIPSYISLSHFLRSKLSRIPGFHPDYEEISDLNDTLLRMTSLPEEYLHPLAKEGSAYYKYLGIIEEYITYFIPAVGEITEKNLFERSCPTRSIEFEWMHSRKRILSCQRPMIWDIGAHVLLYFDNPQENFKTSPKYGLNSRAKGRLIPKNWFIDFLSSSCKAEQRSPELALV